MPVRMRILQLGKFYPIKGGVEKVMWDLTRGLSEKGVGCDMLCACLKDEMPEGREIIFNPRGRVICVPALKKVAATMLAPSMPFVLRRMLKKAAGEGRPYDIVHVHHPDPMAALSLFLSGWKGKVVLHWHSDIIKQKGLLKLYMPLQNWLIGRADKIVGTTPVYVRESPNLKAASDKLGFLPIGVEEVERVDPAPHSGKIVYSLGRLVGYKGYEYLVEAARWLPENCRVVIGGGGPLDTDLRARAAALEAESTALKAAGKAGFASVEFLGRVPDDEIARRYNECDVFCLPSVWKTEAFGIVQVEAMSCGKPVVATKIPGSGVSWVNEDGVSGINVNPGDPKAIADAVLSITSGDASYRTFSEGARRRFEENFTFGRMISSCMSIYETVLK